MYDETKMKKELKKRIGAELSNTTADTLLEWAVPVIRKKLPVLMDKLMKKIGELIESANKKEQLEKKDNSILLNEKDFDEKGDENVGENVDDSLKKEFQESINTWMIEKIIPEITDTVVKRLYRDMLDDLTDEAIIVIEEKVKEISFDITKDLVIQEHKKMLNAVQSVLKEIGIKPDQISSITNSILKYYEEYENIEE